MKHWTSEAKAEYAALLSEVVTAERGTTARVDLMEVLMVDAVQAQRGWAIDADREARRSGYRSQIKAHLKRSRVLFSHDGQLLSKPSVIGTKRVAVDGVKYDVQELIVALTFDELRDKRIENLRQVTAYNANIALLDKLIALSVMCPGAATPIDASTHLALDLEAYLAAEAA